MKDKRAREETKALDSRLRDTALSLSDVKSRLWDYGGIRTCPECEHPTVFASKDAIFRSYLTGHNTMENVLQCTVCGIRYIEETAKVLREVREGECD